MSDSIKQTSRRKHPRREAHLFVLLGNIPVENGHSRPQVGYTRDISATGLFLHTPGIIREGERLTLTIYPCSDWSAEVVPARFEVEGAVVRVEQGNAADPSGCFSGAGVRFTGKPVISLEDDTQVSPANAGLPR